jgi:hypothetical protein
MTNLKSILSGTNFTREGEYDFNQREVNEQALRKLEAEIEHRLEKQKMHLSEHCPRCAWEAGRNFLPKSLPHPHDCVCTEYGPCLKHQDEMKVPGLFDDQLTPKHTKEDV